MGFLLHVYIASGPRYGEMIKQRSSYTPYHSNIFDKYVLQYLTRSALSRVESRHIRVFRLFTFPAFLSKTRQYTQDFIVPSNFHHNLDRL